MPKQSHLSNLDEDYSTNISPNPGIEVQNPIVSNDNPQTQTDQASDYTSSSGASSEWSESVSDSSVDEENENGSLSDEDGNASAEDQDTGSSANFSGPSLLSTTDRMLPGDPSPQSSDLFSRLTEFLPSIRAANAQLEDRISRGEASGINLEVDEEDLDEPHVDMNLGLGVLEQPKDADSQGKSDCNSSDEGLSDDDAPPAEQSTVSEKRKADVLDVLMNRKKRRKPEIEEVDSQKLK